MSHTERYRAQHAEIMRLATDLGRLMSVATLSHDAAGARATLSELSGKLLVHLAAEDNLLYPKLLQSPATATQTVARRFLSEMGPISKSFKEYAVRWGSARAIQADTQSFVTETKAVLDALSERIRREHAELYPLADAS